MQSSCASQSRAVCLWLAVDTSLDGNVHLCLWCGKGPGSGNVDVLAQVSSHQLQPQRSTSGREIGRLPGFSIIGGCMRERLCEQEGAARQCPDDVLSAHGFGCCPVGRAG